MLSNIYILQVAVWDVRTHRPIATQTAPRAVRSVKFSAQSVDLLAYAEHDANAHLVDTRRWGARQSLAVTAPHVGVSGIAFTPDVRRP